MCENEVQKLIPMEFYRLYMTRHQKLKILQILIPKAKEF